ncbi:hypothetical protein ACHQM5_009915 [Ranunculus cassubicifolius]
MATPAESWIREFDEALKLADDVTAMMSERGSLPPSGPVTQRHLSSTRRKVTILRTRLDTLKSLLLKLPSKHKISNKEMRRRENILENLQLKANEMASSLNMSNFGNRDNLLDKDSKPPDLMIKMSNLDNRDIVGFQRQVIKEQDEDLQQLEETILSTKHIALAINEELDLQKGLLETLDEQVESTSTRLQRLQRRLAILNKRTKGGCTCMGLLLSVLGIVILVAIAWELIKYL